jgi:hypothetical protein
MQRAGLAGISEIMDEDGDVRGVEATRGI